MTEWIKRDEIIQDKAASREAGQPLCMAQYYRYLWCDYKTHLGGSFHHITSHYVEYIYEYNYSIFISDDFSTNALGCWPPTGSPALQKTDRWKMREIFWVVDAC